MKQVIRENTNRIYLEDANFIENLFTVTVSIFDEAGNFAKDSTNADIQDKTAIFDTTLNQYYIEILFLPTLPIGYLRAFWDVIKISDGVTQNVNSAYTPQDLELVSYAGATSQEPQIVPISFFLDNYVMKNEKLDAQYKQAIDTYIASNRNDISRWLMASQGNLELTTKLTFFTKQETIKSDYYSQIFQNEYWLQQPYNRPVISLESFKLVYGAQEVDLITEIKNFIIVDQKMGTLQFLPISTSGTFYQVLMMNINALALTAAFNTGSVIPSLFHYTYTYGLNFITLDQSMKESIRQAISRNTLIRLLPIIDPSVRITSSSKSMDGVSKSQTSGIAAMLKEFKEEEKQWVADIKMKYGTMIDMAIA
jgi:hypothetical protein